MTDATSIERHRWIEDARAYCVRLLDESGCSVPESVRITIGFPSTGGRGKVIGECWAPESVTDSVGEVFISPRLRDSVQVLGVLIHELIHAGVGNAAKHGPKFRKPALAVGLTGKMTATEVGPDLRVQLERWVAERGDYPAGAVMVSTRKKQTTRLLKCECEACGYTVRVASKWLVEVGAPHCPDHGEMAIGGAGAENRLAA